MLRSLFKYDFKAIGKNLVPIYLITFIICVFTSFLFRVSGVGLGDPLFFQIILMVFAVASICFFIFMGLYTIYQIIVYFYRSTFEKESYVFHTAPISTHAILGLKFLNSFIWYLLTGLTSFITIVSSCYIIFSNKFDLIQDLIERIYTLLLQNDNLKLYLFLLVLNHLIDLFFWIMSCFLAAAFAHHFDKPVIVGIICFVVVTFVTQVISIQILEHSSVTNFSFLIANGKNIFDLSISIYLKNIGVNLIYTSLAYIATYLITKKKNI